MKKRGRKSLKDELTVLRRYNQLAPSVFRFVSEMLESKNKKDKQWAADWLKPAYVRMIPQTSQIGGDPNNQTPIPISNVFVNAIPNHNRNTQNLQNDQTH